MKRVLLWTGIFSCLLTAVGLISYVVFANFLNGAEGGAENNPETMVDESVQANLKDTKLSVSKNGEATVETEVHWTERKIIRTLHEMTHQKVEASEKWGAVPMTRENVKKMMGVVKNRKDDLEHYDLYTNILQMWEEGNFSHVDEQHNKFWNMEDGTIGKATGILSEAEEQAFIETHFSDVEGTFEW